jgi:hypothetical protein
MKESWLQRFVVVVLVLVPFLFVEAALAQNNVTFQVRMNIKMREQSFLPGSGDIVRAAGSFNGWGGSTDTLTDGNNDSVYTKTVSIAAGAIEYKFLKTLRGGLDWEGVANRQYTVVAGNQTVDVVYFDNDSVYTPPANVGVTFRVNMRVKLLEGAFQPQNGDVVRVAGSMNGWGSSTDTLVDVPPTDSIYQKTLTLNEGQSIEYKFLKTLRGGSDWEGVANRPLTVPTGGTTLPAPFFDNDSIINVAINANIVWRVDMRAMQNIGWFAPGSNDSVQVRGAFEGWGGTRMAYDPISQLYRVTAPYSGYSFDQIAHKFFIKVDSLSANTRFPGWATNADGLQYDHPYERGDGNRMFDVQNGGNIVTPSYYFSSIHRYATLNNTTDTSRVTIRVNMGPATRYIDPFNPATDTLKLVFFDDMWYRAQIANQGSFSSEQMMTPQGPNDSIWTVSFKVKGKAHAGLLYYYRFIHPGGNTVNEGGGLGATQPYRSRFIQPTGPNAFPATYAAPVDSWQKDAPMPCETPIFGTTDVANQDMGVPEVYKLEQNYPNPFNPSTRISYAIPENAKVTLKIYNLLGQEVATLVNEEQQRGNHAALFEANKLSTGVYFYRLDAGKFSQTRKMLLLK